MPTWKIHLNVGSSLVESLGVKDRDGFLFGNVAPDIRGGYVVPCEVYRQESIETHFYKTRVERMGLRGQALPDLEKYLKAHHLDSDISLGYAVHLLTDYFWNDLVNNRSIKYRKDASVLGIATLKIPIVCGDLQECNMIKQFDFRLFSRYLKYTDDMKIQGITDIQKEELLDRYGITNGDIYRTLGWINETYFNEEPESKNLRLFTLEEYQVYLGECKEFVVRSISELRKKEKENTNE